MLLFLVIGCKDDDSDVYDINYDRLETVNALVVDTRAGWTLLTEKHGFLELFEPLHDSLKIDALKVEVQLYTGRTYHDDIANTLDNDVHRRDFTFAVLEKVRENPLMYAGPSAPVIEIFWSQDYDTETEKHAEGYGYFVQADKNGLKIGQVHFPDVSGRGAFRTENEAYKVAMHVMHSIMVYKGFPSTGRPELDFLKIDWYVWFPPD